MRARPRADNILVKKLGCDSDYDLQQDDDDAQFEANVANPRVVEEFDDMGFKGESSDDGGD